MMKKICLLFLLIVSTVFSQEQVKIPWPSLADSPWPILRGDMQGTGRSEFVGPSTNNILWRKDMPLGVLFGPVIGYDDVLYMGTRALSGDSVNYFYAVDKNGYDLWTFNTEGSTANTGGPILTSDSTVYFFSGNKTVYALYSNGNLKWKIGGIWAGGWPFHSIAKNGDLYIGVGDTLFIISSEGGIKNKITIPDLIPGMVFSTGGDTMYFWTGGFNNRPGALNASDLNGNIYWSYEFATHNWGIPLVDNANKIYVFGTDSLYYKDYLYCINPDGTVDWRYQVNWVTPYAAPTMDRKGNIIINARKDINSEERNCIISLDYYGNENWVTPFEGDWEDYYIDHGLVCDAEGKIYCGSSTAGNFYCISSNGEILWTLDLGDYEYDSDPAIGSDGTLYIGTHISSLTQNHKQNLIAVKDKVSSINDNEQVILEYSLSQNYPNPFNPTTKIDYSIKEGGHVTLKVYDILGRVVAELVNENKPAGNYTVEFNAANLPSGVYIYKLTAGKFTAAKKLMLMK